MADRTAAVVVAYFSAGPLAECLEAVVSRVDQTIVVDNGSGDDTLAVAARWPRVEVIANPDNTGFAAAANLGFMAARAEFVLLLNPDAVLTTSVAPLVDACRRPGAAGAAGLLLGNDGLPQTGFQIRRLPDWRVLAFECLGLNRVWPGNPVNRRYRCHGFDYSRPSRIEQPAGAMWMIRRSVWQACGGFDSRFWPLWFEDVDLAARMARAGYQTWYEPESAARHSGAHSISRLEPGDRRVFWYGNLLKFACGHFRPWQVRLLGGAVIAGVAVRVLLETLAGKGGRAWSGCGKVVGFAATYLLFGRAPGTAVSGGGKVSD